MVAYRTQAAKWTAMSVPLRIWTIAVMYLPVLASIGGFAALMGDDRAIRLGRMDAPDSGDIPFAGVCYAVAAFGIIMLIAEWLRHGRRRAPGLRLAAVVTFVFGAVGIPLAHMLAARDGVGVGFLLVPTYVMMALAAALFVLAQLSPPPEPEAQLDLEDLDDKTVAYLLKQRSKAIDELVKRGMLPDEDIDALKARPIGRLHLEEDA